MNKVEPFSSRPTDTNTNSRIDGLVKAIFAVVDGFAMTNHERDEVLRQVREKFKPIPVPRAGDVLNTVVSLIPRNRDWTVRELKRRVEIHGNTMSDKELYNAIGYLTRKQHIHRIGPGRYIINGVAVATSDDLGGRPSVTEGDQDD